MARLRYMVSFYAMIDFLAIFPYYVAQMSARVDEYDNYLRLLRLLRIIKVVFGMFGIGRVCFADRPLHRFFFAVIGYATYATQKEEPKTTERILFGWTLDRSSLLPKDSTFGIDPSSEGGDNHRDDTPLHHRRKGR